MLAQNVDRRGRRKRNLSVATETRGKTSRRTRSRTTRSTSSTSASASAAPLALSPSSSRSPSPPPDCSALLSDQKPRFSSETLSGLPYLERYREQQKACSPFTCLACEKSFPRSLIRSHIKSRHRKANALVSIRCEVCGHEFEGIQLAEDHVREVHKVFNCSECDERFSEFELIKDHLKVKHSTDWPWICGFCDHLFFFDLEFQIHVLQHTHKPPFTCPLCEKSEKNKANKRKRSNKLHYDVNKLTEHVTFDHLPTMTSTMAKADVSNADKSSAAEAQKTRDENAVNREIANLLLNLHASRTDGVSNHQQQQTHHPEDLSNKPESAIDLSKAKPAASSEGPLNMKVEASSLDLSGKASDNTSSSPMTSAAAAAAAAVSNPYTFYPSLASMASINPNYFLQNLLQIGKMQQQIAAVASTTTSSSTPATHINIPNLSASTQLNIPSVSSTSSASLSFPTQPIPAQALTLPNGSGATSLKPPASVLKTALPSSNGHVNAMISSGSTPTTVGATSQGNTSLTKNIPFLCGQIVTQLNGLLFLVHSLNNTQIELSLQTQLTAIYNRLQEVVAMVEQTKKQQEELNKAVDGKNVIDVSKIKDEESIAKQIQDYQRALLQRQSKLPSQITSLADNPASVVSLLKQQQPNGDVYNNGNSAQMPQVESSTSTGKRRRGRPPKNSNSDLSYSPPEKRSKAGGNQTTADHNTPESTTPLLANGTNTEATKASGGGNGKGIRNRVFCGECAGCLKNDDCGRCRYCQDKTKFGGQNRLRQKCLHRRCQMDTHRKRSNNNNNNNNNNNGGTNNNGAGHDVTSSTAAKSLNGKIDGKESFKETLRQSPSPTSIYSGVDLARLAAASTNNNADKNAASNGNNNLIENKTGEIGHVDEEDDAPVDSAKGDGQSKDINGEESEDQHNKQEDANDGEQTERNTRSRKKSQDSNSEEAEDDSEEIIKGSGNTGKSSNKSSSSSSSSRIDKWKAKHEAMLKMAEDNKKSGSNTRRKKQVQNDSKEQQKTEGGNDGKVQSPEIPDLDPDKGVCIDLGSSDENQGTNKSKPHTRQQALMSA